MKTPRRVLHVDDDPTILKLVARKLKSHQVEVISISDPMIAISQLIETGARIVILDIDMPGKNGLALLKEIKQLDAGIQVIMCTGMVSLHTVLNATMLGAETCIFKPIVNLNEVTEAIDRAFEKIDRMWLALKDWLERKQSGGEQIPVLSEIESQLASSLQGMLDENRITLRSGPTIKKTPAKAP
jgi:DNA-binding NtrC family response regulator